MADLSITAANVLASAGASIDFMRAALATITPGQALYVDATSNKYGLADNDSATAGANVAKGIALNPAGANQPVAVLRGGDITIGATLIPGAAYCLSSTPGGICPVADLGTGANICQIGLAISTSMLRVNFQTPGVTHA